MGGLGSLAGGVGEAGWRGLGEMGDEGETALG